MSTINGALEIERLLKFALKNRLIENLDVIPCRNALMDLLKIREPYMGEAAEEAFESPNAILNNLLDYAAAEGIIEQDTTTFRDLMDSRIMGLLMPRQSEVVKNFYETVKNEGVEKATKDFYSLSKASNYIRMDRIEKNLYWLSETDYGKLEITINLSKPEKDPRDIAAAKAVPQASYPKCLLCIENVGYSGNVNHPARQNHRVIPVQLAEEQWYFQYSPYVYYNEHCILFKEEHVPMKISDKTFKRLITFVEQFPHYFIGSNADLPIVGGSILTHEHFQGGRHVFPMEEAPAKVIFSTEKYKEVRASIVKWPLSVIRLSSLNKEKLLELSIDILDKWREYSHEEVGILAYSEVKGQLVPHNTITPIARINKAGEFEMDLVLRNNRISEEHPDGIFHPHKELHHIKKENIGLIEVMGLAVLPARLNTELVEIKEVLMGNIDIKTVKEDSELYKHIDWIKELVDKYGNSKNAEEADKIIKLEVGEKFLKVLMDAGVYKVDDKGMAAFMKFMETAGFKEI